MNFFFVNIYLSNSLDDTLEKTESASADLNTRIQYRGVTVFFADFSSYTLIDFSLGAYYLFPSDFFLQQTGD